MANDPLVEKLAKKFASVLESWLTVREMDEVIRRNRVETGDVCHSHDFCDANMAMWEAYQVKFARDPDLDDDNDLALINAAWSEAIANRFYCKQEA